ncbi:MAG: hypothetical protein WD063_19260 [Pirellulales bacterium]
MKTTHSPETSPFDVARTVARHWRLSASFLVASGLVTLLVFWYFPRTYRSESKLYIRAGRETASLDATAMIGRTFAGPLVNAERENEINSVTETLRSRLLLERVVDAVTPQAVLSERVDLGSARNPARDADPTATDRAASGEQNPMQVAGVQFEGDWTRALSDRERAVLKLQKMIDVERVKKSDVVGVTCESHNPRLAQMIVGRLVDFYLAEHLRLNRTPGAHEFLEHQTAQMLEQLARTEEELRLVKNETGIAAPDDQRSLIVTKAARLEDELLTTSAMLAGTEAEVNVLREKVAKLPDRIVTARTDDIPSHDADLMRNELYRLQMIEQELTSRYTDEHFSVKQIRERTVLAKKVLAETDESHDQITLGPNSVYDQTEVSLVKQESLLAALRTKEEVLKAQLTRVRGDIKEFNANELRVARLLRDQKRFEDDYQAYTKHLEQARIDNALEVGRISSINILQPATFEPKPVTFKTSLILYFGLLIGLVGAIGLPMVAESLDSPFENSQDVENHLGIPVLASIPRFRSEQLSGNGTTQHSGNGTTQHSGNGTT